MLKDEISVILQQAIQDSTLKDELYGTLRISIYHTKTGYGGFDWKLQKGGYKLSFKPVQPTQNGFKSVLMSGDKWLDGFYILLSEDEGRKNPHKIKRLLAKVEAQKDAFAAAYSAKDIEALRVLAEAIKE